MAIELPSELVTEILARVPVKDLVRFICVCKRWRLLLRSKNFIKSQMTYAPRKLLAMHDNGDSPPRSILYEQENNAKPRMTLQEADLMCGDKRLVELDVIAHCDGLFCLRLQDRTLAVWNPLLRQVRKVYVCSGDYLETMGHFGAKTEQNTSFGGVSIDTTIWGIDRHQYRTNYPHEFCTETARNLHGLSFAPKGPEVYYEALDVFLDI